MGPACSFARFCKSVKRNLPVTDPTYRLNSSPGFRRLPCGDHFSSLPKCKRRPTAHLPEALPREAAFTVPARRGLLTVPCAPARRLLPDLRQSSRCGAPASPPSAGEGPLALRPHCRLLRGSGPSMRLRWERRPLGLPGPRAPGSRLLGDSVTRCRPCARQPRPPSHAAPRFLPGTACSFRSPLFARLRRRDEASTGRCCGLSACPQVRSRKPVLGAGLAAMRTGGSHTVPGLDSLTAMRSGPLQGGPRVSLLGGAACWGGRPIPGDPVLGCPTQ